MAYVLGTPTSHFVAGERLSFARFAFCVIAIVTLLLIEAAHADNQAYDRDDALRESQSAIGNSLGDYTLHEVDGEEFHLATLNGKPYLVSLVFTSCHHICPAVTRHIDATSRAARDVLGDDSFEIVTIGFDTANDTPQAMQSFARQQGIDAGNWRFLSASPETITALSEDLGFLFFPSPRGFDHLNQVSVIDRQGAVYSQVYGVRFELPALVEPLKQLVFNRPESVGHPFSGLVDRVRLFCTVFNPATGRYETDNSLFIQTAVGLMIVLSVAIYLLREANRARRT